MSYVDINTFSPSVVAKTIPQTRVPDAVTETQYARERFLAVSTSSANPPFKLTSSYNRLSGADGAITRGYIRRSDIDAADPTSPYRLYFMYNPEVIRRNYIAYLDQQALDPGNAMFGSNNMSAAPGILDFSFELLFDRQIEVATDPLHPGTKIDYDYFDLVVRGVVPDSNTSGNAIPDNGIMMVNPSNITVVFGQDLSVHGRAYNANVRFEKFSNRMVPMRMRIGIQMKVFYIGPTSSLPNYSSITNNAVYEATVPYDESVSYSVTYEEVSDRTLSIGFDSSESPFIDRFNSGGQGGGTGSQYTGPVGQIPPGIPQGPFPLRITRRGLTSVTSAVAPVSLNGDQILALLMAKQCPVDGAVFLWALAKRESGFVANAAGINTDGSTDAGLWQINSTNWGIIPAEMIADPWTNVDITIRLSRNGTWFVPWQLSGNYQTPDGSHLRGVNMQEAYDFFRSRGYAVG